jgi:hypothetical protein
VLPGGSDPIEVCVGADEQRPVRHGHRRQHRAVEATSACMRACGLPACRAGLLRFVAVTLTTTSRNHPRTSAPAGAIRGLCAALLAIASFATPSLAAEYHRLPIVRVRVASLSRATCSGAPCIRIGVVIIFRSTAGGEASISTQYFSRGDWTGSVQTDFGAYAPYVIALVRDRAAAAAPVVPDLPEESENLRREAERTAPFDNSSATPLPDRSYQVLAVIAGEYFRAVGDRMRVTGVDGDDAIIAAPADAPRLQRISDAIPGVTYTAASQRLRMNRVTARLWVRAFIPGDVPGTTQVLANGPHAGRSAVRVPVTNRCFLTDQRSFSNAEGASARMAIEVSVDLTLGAVLSTPSVGRTIGVDCDTGSSLCERTQSTGQIVHRNVSADIANGERRVFVTLSGAASNPCVTPSPDIDWTLVVTLRARSRQRELAVHADGLIEPFPAFEAYVVTTGSPVELFSRAPQPGSSPLGLGGPANIAVTVAGTTLGF